MRVYLVGFMSCGKSSIGRRLSNSLGWAFIDLDEEIEAACGKTIPEIFADEGEDAFRRHERAALEASFGRDNVIVATGGGCPCHFDNMDRINAAGTSFYLRADSAFLLSKLLKAGAKRPLVKGKSEAELRRYIVDTLKKREPFYLKADYVLPARRGAKKLNAKLIAGMVKVLKKG